MENNVPFQLHFFPIKWNANGIETEWKRNGKKKQKSSGNKVNWNGVELEWKWNGKLKIKKS